MSTYQLSQQRLKCGEVFVWDCVGELFAIECLLCEERPLCTLAEFAEHMEIWHYDWTAEAHASLPDTTTSECWDTLPTEWAAMKEYTDSASDSNEFETDHFESEEETDFELKGQVKENVEVEALTESESQLQAITFPEYSESAVILDTPAQFEELMISMQSPSSDSRTAEVDNSLCLEETQWRGTEENRANGVQADTMNAVAEKGVSENSVLQRLKTEKLIEIYEKFPELWHKQLRSEVKAETEAKAYRSISLELKQHGINLKATAIQRRLGVLRKRYRLEKLTELKSYLENRTYNSSYEFYTQLQFLKEHIEPQLCKICKRICKDATKCCGSRYIIVAQGEVHIPNNDVVESKEEMECKMTELVSGSNVDTGVLKTGEGAEFLQNVISGGVMPEATLEKEFSGPHPSAPEHHENELEIEASPGVVMEPTDNSLKQQEEVFETSKITTLSRPSRRCKNTKSQPKAEKRTLRKRNKVEILEVLELQSAFNFNAQEPEVSTSMVGNNLAEMMPSTIHLEATTMGEENMVSEEYDSSNGDSGILRDFDEQNDVEDNDNDNLEETESFARLTTEQVHKLIQFYKQYPMLWDPDHIDFSTRERRRNAWRQLTAQLNVYYQMRYTWMTVHRKMHDFIKYYRRERQRIEFEGGCTKWCFYDDFAFMAHVVAEQGSDVTKLMLNRQQNRKMIEVYAEYPQLWNINHAQFKRRRLRQGFFKSMSDKLRDTHHINISPLKLRQRIVEFRCTYRLEKERRFIFEQQGGETYKPCYEYYKLLNFLDPHVAPFICTKCGVQYKKQTEIERHMRQEHSNMPKLENSYQPPMPETERKKKAAALANVCHICGISFTQQRNLKGHIKRHSEQRLHACASCPKKFFERSTLRVHERSHTKKRPFICDQCGISYVSGSKLNQHMKRHSNQRDFPCEVCGKAFYSAFACDRHMRRHMNIREKVCPVCGKDFSVGSSYYAHMLLHSDEKRYKCTMCCKQFAQFAGLYKHRRRYHPTEFAKTRAKKNEDKEMAE